MEKLTREKIEQLIKEDKGFGNLDIKAYEFAPYKGKSVMLLLEKEKIHFSEICLFVERYFCHYKNPSPAQYGLLWKDKFALLSVWDLPERTYHFFIKNYINPKMFKNLGGNRTNPFIRLSEIFAPYGMHCLMQRLKEDGTIKFSSNLSEADKIELEIEAYDQCMQRRRFEVVTECLMDLTKLGPDISELRNVILKRQIQKNGVNLDEDPFNEDNHEDEEDKDEVDIKDIKTEESDIEDIEDKEGKRTPKNIPVMPAIPEASSSKEYSGDKVGQPKKKDEDQGEIEIDTRSKKDPPKTSNENPELNAEAPEPEEPEEEKEQSENPQEAKIKMKFNKDQMYLRSLGIDDSEDFHYEEFFATSELIQNIISQLKMQAQTNESSNGNSNTNDLMKRFINVVIEIYKLKEESLKLDIEAIKNCDVKPGTDISIDDLVEVPDVVMDGGKSDAEESLNKLRELAEGYKISFINGLAKIINVRMEKEFSKEEINKLKDLLCKVTKAKPYIHPNSEEHSPPIEVMTKEIAKELKDKTLYGGYMAFGGTGTMKSLISVKDEHSVLNELFNLFEPKINDTQSENKYKFLVAGLEEESKFMNILSSLKIRKEKGKGRGTKPKTVKEPTIIPIEKNEMSSAFQIKKKLEEKKAFKEIKNKEDLEEFKGRVLGLRKKAPTKYNPESSRSHLMIFIKILLNDKEHQQFLICDMGGLEKIDAQKGTDLYEDSIFLNKSLRYIKDEYYSISIGHSSPSGGKFYPTLSLINNFIPIQGHAKNEKKFIVMGGFRYGKPEDPGINEEEFKASLEEQNKITKMFLKTFNSAKNIQKNKKLKGDKKKAEEAQKIQEIAGKEKKKYLIKDNDGRDDFFLNMYAKNKLNVMVNEAKKKKANTFGDGRP